MHLPESRMDGTCCDCLYRQAVTLDGRLCRVCLRNRIIHDTPMIGCKRKYRSVEQRQKMSDEDDPWEQNAIRCLEDG